MAKDKIKKGNWERTTGPSVKELSIGIVGAGRIGSRLIEILEPLKPKKILIHDLQSKDSLIKKYSSLNIQQVSLDELIKESDLVTLHVPLYKKTENLINKEILQLMKENSYIINTARGGLIDESALFSYIESGKIIGAALDVFEEEPYSGPLKDLDQTILTQHMGSCTFESRLKMELEAATEIINYKNKTPYLNPVPQEEYLRQEEK